MTQERISIGEENGKFFLIGPDGYSTTQEKWTTAQEAEEAKMHEEKEEFLIWVY
jgi:hypothetical protein